MKPRILSVQSLLTKPPLPAKVLDEWHTFTLCEDRMFQQGWTQATGSTNAKYQDNVIPVETAAKIVQMAQESLKNPKVSETARNVVRDLIDENASPFFAVLSEIQAVYNIMTEKIRYTRDPHGVELVYGPEFVLEEWLKGKRWADDCDTYATLLMAFFMAIGRFARVVIVSFQEQAPEQFEHVFVEVFLPGDPIREIPGRWVTVDPSTGPHVRKMISRIKHWRYFYPQ